MILGMVNCTLVFLLVVRFGGGHVPSWQPRVTALTLTWLFAFVLVAFAEEVLNRGFIMAVLRRCRNHVFVLIFLSLRHLWGHTSGKPQRDASFRL
mgnify:CR=1 FL=1